MQLNNEESDKSFSSDSCSLNSENDSDAHPPKKSKNSTVQFGPKKMQSHERIILSGVIQKYSFKDDKSSKKQNSIVDKKEPEEEEINEIVSSKQLTYKPIDPTIEFQKKEKHSLDLNENDSLDKIKVDEKKERSLKKDEDDF